MLRNTSTFLWLSIVLTAAACSESGGGGDGDGDDCAPGSEGCPCDQGTCEGTLECRSNLCVEGGGTGGATGGTSGAGTGGTGGTSGGNGGAGTGTGGTTGGSSGSSTGGAPGGMAGAQSTGGAGNSGAGSGGAAGTGGSTPCTDTMSDSGNCGTCGHVCESGMCRAGVCDPYPGPCFDEPSGFTTCDAACQGVGEVCVPNGCGAGTNWTWPSVERLYCEMNIAPDEAHQGSCSALLTFNTGRAFYRCCCTDTH